MLLNIQKLISLAQCYEEIRKLRWSKGVECTECHSKNIKQYGRSSHEPDCCKYRCKDCGKYFDDLTGTIFSGHHQPLTVWILCLYFMGLNLSNLQIAEELDLNESDVYQMTTQLREGIEQKIPEVTLSGTVEMDEVYVVAGHKGQPEEVKKKIEKADETV